MTDGAPRAGMMTLEQTARLLMLSKERVRQLVAEGRLPKADRNQYPIIPVVQDYIRLKEDEVRRVREAASDNDLRAARQREIEQRTAIKRRDLIDLKEADLVLQTFIGVFKAEMNGLAGRVTRDPALKRAIEKKQDEAFVRIDAALATGREALREGYAYPAQGRREPRR